MKRHRRDLEMMSEMNLTNLLDMAFVLLIAFILVAPSMRHGMKMDLPQVEQSDITSAPKTVTIDIKKAEIAGNSDQILVDDRRLTLDELKTVIQEKRLLNKDIPVVVAADRLSSYETFAQVISLVKSLGIENIGLETSPLDTTAATGNKEKKK